MRFLLVDRIDEVEFGCRIHGWKNAAMSEDYFEWHFPERPIVPGVLILEAFAQLAGWLEAAESDFERWVLLDRVRTARYYAFAGPGDRIDLDLEVIEGHGSDRRVYRAEGTVGGKQSARIEFEARVVPLGRIEDAERARRMYDVLLGKDEAAGGR